MHRERVFILIRFSGHAPRAHKKICSLPNFIFPVGGDFINAQKKEADKASFFDLLLFNSAAHHFFQHSLVQLAHAGQDRMNILRQPMA